MRHTVSICVALVVLALLAGLAFDASAQTIKRVGISANYAKIAYPGQTWSWQISNGLKAVGAGTKAFWMVDTLGSGQTGAPSWAIVSAPGGSAAALDSTGTMGNSLTTDVVGQYIVSVTVGTTTVYDSIWASNYRGMTADANAGCLCHGEAAEIKTNWESTGHAKIFKEGVSGELEVVAETNQGLYATGCIRCHTTGFQYELNNGNFGYLAHNNPAPSPNSWDSTWWVGFPRTADGADLMIPAGDPTTMDNLPVILKPVSAIGCESCHGPLDQHMSTFDMTASRVGKSLSADVCNQCHDASGKHSIGSYARYSKHDELETGSETKRASCYPCHSGGAFVEWVKAGKDTTGFAAAGKWTAASGGISIACATCHDPHGKNDSANPWNLRTTTVDSLLCGYIPTTGGEGQLCMNCHKARYDVRVRVQPNNPPYFGFVNRYGPHESPQADMFLGVGGYQYDDNTFYGVNTHGSLEKGCITCHMSERGSGLLPNHQMSMDEAEYVGTTFDPLEACAGCHGTITDYDDIKAFYDFDRNGTIEGVQTEIQSLLDELKTKLPQDPLTGEPVNMTKDSLLVKDRADYVEGIWNYYLVKNDKSMGIHNAAYAAALLRKSLGLSLSDVKMLDPKVPQSFVLNQNYPNPFNPTTNISFALPTSEQVKIEIYNVTGELVKVLADETFSAGTFQVTWDGSNKSGVKTPSGMYIYRLQAGSFTTAKKMLMLK